MDITHFSSILYWQEEYIWVNQRWIFLTCAFFQTYDLSCNASFSNVLDS